MNLSLAIAAAGLFAAALCAQTGLNRAKVGEMLDERGSLRPVFGIGGSFTSGAPVAERVLSIACSRRLCVAKTDSAILSRNSSVAAPSGPAMIGLDGASAWFFFSSTRQVGYWQAGTLSLSDLDADGEVLSIQAGLRLAVRRESGVWIISGDGTILDSLPAETGPVLLIEGGSAVYATPDSVVLRRAGGSELRFTAGGGRCIVPGWGGLRRSSLWPPRSMRFARALAWNGCFFFREVHGNLRRK